MKWWDKYFEEPMEQIRPGFQQTAIPDQGFIVVPVPDPIVLGYQAQDALRNPAIQIALDKIEAEIVSAWKTSAPKDEQGRERLYYRLEGLAAFKAKLTGMVQNMRIEINQAKPATVA